MGLRKDPELCLDDGGGLAEGPFTGQAVGVSHGDVVDGVGVLPQHGEGVGEAGGPGVEHVVVLGESLVLGVLGAPGLALDCGKKAKGKGKGKGIGVEESRKG